MEVFVRGVEVGGEVVDGKTQWNGVVVVGKE